MGGQMTVEQYEREKPIHFSQAMLMLCIGKVSTQGQWSMRNRGVKDKSGNTVYFGWFRQGGHIMTTAEAVARWKKATNWGAE